MAVLFVHFRLLTREFCETSYAFAQNDSRYQRSTQFTSSPFGQPGSFSFHRPSNESTITNNQPFITSSSLSYISNQLIRRLGSIMFKEGSSP